MRPRDVRPLKQYQAMPSLQWMWVSLRPKRWGGRIVGFIVWKIAFEVSFIVALIEMWYIYILYIYYPVYHTLLAYIIIMSLSDVQVRKLYWRVNMFEDMVFSSKEKRPPPPHFWSCKNPCSQKTTVEMEMSIWTQPPTKQPRYELVMRKFEDVLGPRSEALRFRCFHSLLTWP